MARTVLVTGAAGGIGICLIKTLSEAGWIVGTDNVGVYPPKDVLDRCGFWVSADLASFSDNDDLLYEFTASILASTSCWPGGNHS